MTIRSEKLVPRGVRMPPRIWRELEERAQRYDLSASWFVRRAVTMYLESDEKLLRTLRADEQHDVTEREANGPARRRGNEERR